MTNVRASAAATVLNRVFKTHGINLPWKCSTEYGSRPSYFTYMNFYIISEKAFLSITLFEIAWELNWRLYKLYRWNCTLLMESHNELIAKMIKQINKNMDSGYYYPYENIKQNCGWENQLSRLFFLRCFIFLIDSHPNRMRLNRPSHRKRKN